MKFRCNSYIPCPRFLSGPLFFSPLSRLFLHYCACARSRLLIMFQLLELDFFHFFDALGESSCDFPRLEVVAGVSRSRGQGICRLLSRVGPSAFQKNSISAPPDFLFRNFSLTPSPFEPLSSLWKLSSRVRTNAGSSLADDSRDFGSHFVYVIP